MSLLRYKKGIVRKSSLNNRNVIPCNKRRRWSAKIREKILRAYEYRSAKHVAIYSSIGSEVDLDDLIRKSLQIGKVVLLPRVIPQTREIAFFQILDYERDTERSTWGIREPKLKNCLPTPMEKIKVVLIPGLAFTREGHRIGYGGGYYDGALKRGIGKSISVGVAFDCQLYEYLPNECHDQRVSTVITEKTL